MAKPEWGIKRLCASCGARFYDLKKNPIICPKCEEVFDPEAVTRLKRSRNSQTADAKAKAAAAAKALAAKAAAAFSCSTPQLSVPSLSDFIKLPAPQPTSSTLE